jgi:hypothetical protein
VVLSVIVRRDRLPGLGCPVDGPSLPVLSGNGLPAAMPYEWLALPSPDPRRSGGLVGAAWPLRDPPRGYFRLSMCRTNLVVVGPVWVTVPWPPASR